MLPVVIDSPVMAKSKEQSKRAISLTLTASYLDLLTEVARDIEGEPSISRLIDIAIRQYLEAKGKLADSKPKPRR